MPTLESVPNAPISYLLAVISYNISYAICIIIFDETIFDIIREGYIIIEGKGGKIKSKSVGNLNDFELFRGIR